MFLSTLLRDYVCAQCHAPLVGVWDEEKKTHIAVCSRDRSHYGVWRKSTLEIRQAQERAEYNEVAMILPDIAAIEHPPLKESAAKSIADLYGD